MAPGQDLSHRCGERKLTCQVAAAERRPTLALDDHGDWTAPARAKKLVVAYGIISERERGAWTAC